MTARGFLTRARLAPVALVALGLVLVATVDATPQEATDKTIFVAVVDAGGKPVKDVTAAEFGVREDGVIREVVSLKPAAQPLYIELLADTTKSAAEYVRDIRVALTAFVRRIGASSPESQIALMEFGQAALTVTNFTSKTADLEKGINKLFPKPDAPSVLLEALVEASNDLAKKPGPRRAIVVLNMEPGDEQSRQEPKKINDALRKSGAQLWAVSLQKGTLKNPARDVVLNVLTKNSGGKRDFIVGQSALETVLEGFADALTSQYEVTYTRPAGTKAQSVQVGVARQNLKMYAPAWAPQ